MSRAARTARAPMPTAYATGHGIARLADASPPAAPPPPGLPLAPGNGGGSVSAETVVQLIGRIDWPYVLGGYAGALAVGGLIGYMAQGSRKGALTGGLTAGAVWSAAETVHQWRAVHWGVGAAFLAWSGTSFYFALKRKPR